MLFQLLHDVWRPALLILILAWLASVFLRQKDDVAACKKIGIRSSRLEHTKQDPSSSSWSIKSLWIYPVKSCKGIELDTGAIDANGMIYDRNFSFAQWTNLEKDNEKCERLGWKFITQRQVPALVRVHIEVWEVDPKSSAYRPDHPNVKSKGVLVIKWPSAATGIRTLKRFFGQDWNRVEIPLDPSDEQIKEHKYEYHRMKIWQDNPNALCIARTSSSDWLRALCNFLEQESQARNPTRRDEKGRLRPGYSFNLPSNPFALFRIDNSRLRIVERNAPTKEQIGYQSHVGFQDAYPLHILGLASVRDVASRLPPHVPRPNGLSFRPNIIISGGTAYDEDHWKKIRIGNDSYYLACRTARCLIPNIDQTTGTKHPTEPDRTLKSFRRIDEGCKTNACLGMQMVPAVGERRVLRVGDRITVLEVGEHRYINSKD